MTRRRLLLVTSGGALAVLTVGILVLLSPRSAITRANGEKILAGMTLDQVEEILDGPARDETTGWTVFHNIDLHPSVTVQPSVWIADRIVIRVHFAPDGRVSTAIVVDNTRLDQGLVGAALGWLGL